MTRFAAGSKGLTLALVLGSVLLVGGCPEPPVPPTPEDLPFLINLGQPLLLTPDQVTQTQSDLVATTLGDRAGALTAGTFTVGEWYDPWLNMLKHALAGSVRCYPVTYRSRDATSTSASDTKIVLTGMLYLPKPRLTDRKPYTVPLLVYPHGTELQRDHVPSRNQGQEWIFGAVAALFGGFAVAMPDLPGMGGADPNLYHPYCHAQSLAYSVVDMVRAMQEAFDDVLPGEYAWDGRLYVLGYSEGGYAAMATVKELQLHAADYPGLSLTGSACLAGPYDLTGAMRQTMVNPDLHFSRPYFLPYMILGYDAVYGGMFDPNGVMAGILMPDIVQWMDGVQSGTDADTEIEQRMGVEPGQVVPREMMSAAWVATQLDDAVYQTSAVGQLLAANNLWSGWAPNRPMLLMASPDDDCVPYANSVKAYDEFNNAGVGNLITFRDIGRPGDGITHVQGAVLGIPQAIIWLKDACPTD